MKAKSKVLTFRIDEETHRKLQEKADKELTTMSYIALRAIRDYLEAERIIEELGGADMIREALKKRIKEGEDK